MKNLDKIHYVIDENGVMEVEYLFNGREQCDSWEEATDAILYCGLHMRVEYIIENFLGVRTDWEKF